MRLLVVEDDVKLAALLARGLRQDGHVVDVEHDGESGQEAARAAIYDAIILDVMLPSKSGLSICHELRLEGKATFALTELEARLRTLTRRARLPPRAILRVADVTFDMAARHVERNGRTITFTSRELAYLEYFMKNAGIVVTRAMLENALWDRDSALSSNAVEVYVRRLRAKLEANGLPRLIDTVHGIGYRFGSPTRAE